MTRTIVYAPVAQPGLLVLPEDREGEPEAEPEPDPDERFKPRDPGAEP